MCVCQFIFDSILLVDTKLSSFPAPIPTPNFSHCFLDVNFVLLITEMILVNAMETF